MRAPLSWIRDFTPLKSTLDASMIAEALDRAGLEVEAVDAPGREVGGVVAARILDVVAHPNADKLRLADVDFGVGETRVVCGAPNIEAGMVVPYAPAGARLPGGITLEPRKIRGVVSDGMLCSARELGLGEDHGGILALDDATEPGTDVVEVLGLGDVVFELAITPNRPDAMSIVGVARELAAHFGLPFSVPEPKTPESGGNGALDEVMRLAAAVTVDVEAPDRCARYLARAEAVTLGPSPEWLARRLTLAGMRPISNVVDVTNYVLLERGQPLHAFDLMRLAGPGIVVRLARDGETITTLDGVTRTLGREDLLICDAERAPQALAGIMGGEHSEIDAGTTAILLESAYFQPMGISRSSKRLGLRSESSARFERGTDPEGVAPAAVRACELLASVASAREVGDVRDVYPEPVERARITLRTTRVNALLGVVLDAAQVRDALVPLGLDVTERPASGGVLDVVAPTFRPDLEREIDLVEEVARRVGLDSLPRTLPPITGRSGGLSRVQRERRLVADALVGVGLFEASTVPLVAPALLRAVGYDGGIVAVANPLRADESALRALVAPGLLVSAARNAANGHPDVGLFELGHVFRPPRAGGGVLPDERDHLAVLLCGRQSRRPLEPDRPVDVYDAVDALTAVLDALRVEPWRLDAAEVPGLATGRSARVVVGDVTVGNVGEWAPTVLDALHVPGLAVGFEIDLGPLWDAPRRDRTFRALSRYPVSTVDLAFAVDDAVVAADVVRTLLGAVDGRVESARCFDEFRSDAPAAASTGSGPAGAGPAVRSLAFAVAFRAPDRTLTEEDVAVLRAACIQAVERAHGARLRGG